MNRIIVPVASLVGTLLSDTVSIIRFRSSGRATEKRSPCSTEQTVPMIASLHCSEKGANSERTSFPPDAAPTRRFESRHNLDGGLGTSSEEAHACTQCEEGQGPTKEAERRDTNPSNTKINNARIQHSTITYYTNQITPKTAEPERRPTVQCCPTMKRCLK